MARRPMNQGAEVPEPETPEQEPAPEAPQPEAPEAPVEVPAEASHPFGKPVVLNHGKTEGGHGVPAADMQPKVFGEANYVPPEERSNLDYRIKQKREELEHLLALQEQEKRDGIKRSFGIGATVKVIGASPNSPQKNFKVVG